MKSKILRNGLSVLTACALTAVAGAAMAGLSYSVPVNINDAYKYAVGTMYGARASSDTVQYIGCYHNAYSSGGSANCYAVNAAGVSRSCYTTNVNMVDAIRSISDESYIYFQWNTDGTCNYVLVDNGSRFRP
ncbi:MAG: hypothetical protein ACREPB_01090 [Arenimonas sp.]